LANVNKCLQEFEEGYWSFSTEEKKVDINLFVSQLPKKLAGV